MKTRVKVAIIGAIGAIAAAVIPVVIRQTGKTGNTSIEKSKNVVIGNITTDEGDVIIEGTKTTNIQALSENQNNGTKQGNEH